jgi:hypothetical protein
MNIVKTNGQFQNDVRYFLIDLAMRRAEATPGRPFRTSEQDRRTAKALARRLDFDEALESAARRIRRRPRLPRPESYRADVIR